MTEGLNVVADDISLAHRVEIMLQTHFMLLTTAHCMSITFIDHPYQAITILLQ